MICATKIISSWRKHDLRSESVMASCYSHNFIKSWNYLELLNFEINNRALSTRGQSAFLKSDFYDSR